MGDWVDLDDCVRTLIMAGDSAAAVTEVMRRLAPEIRGYLARVLGNDVDVDDVLSATTERLWESLTRFEWRCSVRTWAYVIAHHEMYRFRRDGRKHLAGRVPMSELTDLVANGHTATGSALASGRRRELTRLRDELSPEDRELLVLRVDRGLAWHDIALAFMASPEGHTDDERRRVAARLRQRFQAIKKRLAARAREVRLI